MKYDGYRCLLAHRRRQGENLHPLRARLDRQVPRDRRGRARDPTSAPPCSTARSSRSTTRAIPASRRSSRRSARAAAASPCSCSTRSRSTARTWRSCPISSARSGSPRCSARAGRPSSSMPTISSARASNCSRRCARRARKGSSRSGPTRPIAAAAPRPGSRSNARAGRNSSSSAGRESDKKGRGFRALLLGAQRGRQAALRRQGRHRLLAGASSTSCASGSTSSRPTRPPAAGAPRRGARRPLGEAEAGRRDRLRRVHRRQGRPPRQLPRPARRQDGEGGGRAKCRRQLPEPRRGRRQDQQSRPGDLPRREGHQGRARRLLPRGRRADDGVDREPADQPGPLPAGPGKKCFFQKHDSGTFGPHVQHVPIREKDGAQGGLSLCRRRRRDRRLRPDGDDRVPRLGIEGRRRREARPAGLRPRSRRRPRLRRGQEGGDATSSAISPTWACRPSRC